MKEQRMSRLRYADLVRKPLDILDMTSLTVAEFEQLLPSFEAAFQAQMAAWRVALMRSGVSCK
jgi:hypothetical protein